jgi:hypothetical protein
MRNINDLYRLLYVTDSVPGILRVEEFNQTEEYQEMEKISKELHIQLRGKREFNTEKGFFDSAFKIANQMRVLASLAEILHHPIHLNTFKDKYGNIFLQARTSIKDDLGKTKWINAYVGSIQAFEKGIDDPEALLKGQSLIRKKLRPFFGLDNN